MMCIAEYLKHLCLFWIIIDCATSSDNSVSTSTTEERNICANPSGIIQCNADGDKVWKFKISNCNISKEAVLVLYVLPYTLERSYTNSDETRICYSGVDYHQAGDGYVHSFCTEVTNNLQIYATEKFPFKLYYDAYSNRKFEIYYTVINKVTENATFPTLPTPGHFYSTIEANASDEIQEAYREKTLDLCLKPTGVFKYETEGEATWNFERIGCSSDDTVLILFLVPVYMEYNYYAYGQYCYTTLWYKQAGDRFFSNFCTRRINYLRVWATNKFPLQLMYSSTNCRNFSIYYTVINNAAMKDSDPVSTTSTTTRRIDTMTSPIAISPITQEGWFSVNRALAITFGILFAITFIVWILVYRKCYYKKVQSNKSNLIGDSSNIAHVSGALGNIPLHAANHDASNSAPNESNIVYENRTPGNISSGQASQNSTSNYEPNANNIVYRDEAAGNISPGFKPNQTETNNCVGMESNAACVDGAIGNHSSCQINGI